MSDKPVTTKLEEECDPFYRRFYKAAQKGTGVRISANEVQALNMTNIGSWAASVAEGTMYGD